jgi:hypothetical protein
MAEAKKSTKTETKTETKPAESKTAESKPAESTSTVSSETSSGGDAGKSARDSVGGAAVGHYGYFSNIKTPEYKSGWDDIWGGKKSGAKNKAAATAKAAPVRKEPRVAAFDFEDLPADIQAGLAAAARAQLKKARVNYDSRAKAGAVTWRIECKVDR